MRNSFDSFTFFCNRSNQIQETFSLKFLRMVEPIRYVSTNSNLTFDFNYQKASMNLLLKVLRKNDKTSAKLKEELIEKAKNTLGLNRLPESDRVTPFFHCQEGRLLI